LTTTLRYMHLSPAAKDAAVRRLDRRPTGEVPETVGGATGEPEQASGREPLGEQGEQVGAPGTRNSLSVNGQPRGGARLSQESLRAQRNEVSAPSTRVNAGRRECAEVLETFWRRSRGGVEKVARLASPSLPAWAGGSGRGSRQWQVHSGPVRGAVR